MGNICRSRVQAFILQVPRSTLCTQRPVTYIMTVILVVVTENLSISFLLYPSPTDHCATLSLFFLVHNYGSPSSRVGGFTKGPKFNFLLSFSAIFVIFPIYIYYGLMIIMDHEGSINIIINKQRARGYFSLNCIKAGFSKGCIIVISLKGFIANYYPVESTLSSTYASSS